MEDAGQTLPSSVQAASEAPKKERKNKAAAPAEGKLPAKERGKSAAGSGEDKATLEAKAKALKALDGQPGFASREDAALWLREALDGDPAVENLSAAYEQEVNTELTGDADRLIDHSASIKRDLARSEFRLLPEVWPVWHYAGRELLGLLVAAMLLSLCAPLCYNVLKGIASLRPLRTVK